MRDLYQRTPGGPWYCDYTDATGKRHRRSTGTPVRRTAEKIAAKWREDALLVRHGADADNRTTVAELLDEYLDYIGHRSEKHRSLTRSRLDRLLDGIHRPKQITQLHIETTARQIRHHKTGQLLGQRTQSHYIAAAKSFTRWLTDVRQVLSRDPLSATKKPRWDADRKLIRRFLLPDEWHYLEKTPNATLYETAIQTGLRSQEIQALQPAHLHNGYVLLPAKYTKNKKDAKQYITPGLQFRLRTSLPFDVPDHQRLAKLLRRDLQRATAIHLTEGPSNRIHQGFLQPINPQGHHLDFHSLRHTCGAWLAIAGTNPKVIQSVMRHSSIALTLDTYGHLLPGAEQDAVQHFASMLRG